MPMPHQFVQKLLPARGTAWNRQRLPQFPNVSSCAAATGNTRLCGSLQRRQQDPFQTSCLQSTNSNPTSVTYVILYWLNPFPHFFIGVSSGLLSEYCHTTMYLLVSVFSIKSLLPFTAPLLPSLLLYFFYVSKHIVFWLISFLIYFYLLSLFISFFLFTYFSLVISSSQPAFL